MSVGIEQIVSCLNFGKDLSGRITLVVVAYLDDSGKHDSAVVTMAGFVSRARDWTLFEQGSEALFLESGVNVFHAKEFSNGKDDFRGWTDARKREFAEDWFDVAESAGIMRGISMSVVKSNFDDARREHKLLPNTSAYGYCLHIICKTIFQDQEVWDAIETDQFSVVLESSRKKSDRGVGNTFDRLMDENGLTDHIQSFSVARKDSSRALQLADYLAYFSWQPAEQAARDELISRSLYRDIATSRVYTYGELAEGFFPNPDYRQTKPRF